MPGAYKAEHIRLQTDDLGRAVDFYENTLGLAVVSREEGCVYFGCGYDQNYDIAIQKGSPGVEHFAVRVDDSKKLDRYENRLIDEGFEVRRTGNEEPSQEAGIRFELPSQLSLELVTVKDKSYKHYYETALEGRGGLAPLDLSHHNFHSPKVEKDGKLLSRMLEFKVSAVIKDWEEGAFLRRGDMHHDVAIFNHAYGPDDSASHHHTGVIVSSVDHMVSLLDRVNDYGINIEFGIGRHFGGDNIFAYFKAPDGHRIELVHQMTELDDNTPIEYVNDVGRAVSAWHGGDLNIPDSWLSPSGLAK